MATILDSLVVELGLDSSQFIKAQKELVNQYNKTKDVVKKHGETVEKSAKDAGETVQQLTTKFLALFAVVTGGRGLRDFSEWIARSDTVLGRLATNMGVSRQTLYEWQRIAIRMGGSAEDATQSLGKLNQIIQDLKRGRPTEAYSELMIFSSRAAQVGGKSIDALHNSLEDLLPVIAEDAQKLGQVDRAFAVAHLRALGFSDSIINAMIEGKASIDEMKKAIDRLGGPTDKSEAAMKRLWETLSDVKTAAENVGRSIVTAFSPNILPVFDGLINRFIDLQKFFHNVEKAGLFKSLAIDAKGLVENLKKANEESQRITEPGKSVAGTLFSQFMPSAETFKRGLDAIDRESESIAAAFKHIYSRIPDFGQEFKTRFWQAIHSLEAEGALLLESFKRLFNPILEWLGKKFHGLLGWFVSPANAATAGGGGGAADGGGFGTEGTGAAEGGMSSPKGGGDVLVKGPGIELKRPAKPSWRNLWTGKKPTPAGEGHKRVGLPDSASDAMRIAEDQLIKEGVSAEHAHAAAAMLVGNALHESTLNPRAPHDPDPITGIPTGYGIYGARKERRTYMFEWLREHGFAKDSLEGQMRYMVYEALHGNRLRKYPKTRAALMNATGENLNAGVYTVESEFESPVPGSTESRRSWARKVFRNAAPAPSSNQSSPSVRAPTTSGYTESLAHPDPGEFHPISNKYPHQFFHPSQHLIEAENRARINNITNNHTNTDTKIGEVHVHTHATDAQGIARDIKPALERTMLAMHANYSLV